MTTIRVRLNLYPHQRRIRRARRSSRWQCVVMHRRAGKSFYCVTDLLEEALTNKGGDWRGYYIGPSFKQAKAIAFDYLLAMAKSLPGAVINHSELRVDFGNGSRIQLLGVENADSLRGRYADRVIVDESQLMPLSLWTYVIRPMLADRQGSALITGTPNGRNNLLAWAYEQGADSEDWYRVLLPVGQTDMLSTAEQRALRKQMSAEAWQQEMECSFDAATQGAYLAAQMATAEEEGRIAKVVYDPALPVLVSVDLGYGDAMARWFFQRNGNALQFFDYEEDRGLSLEDMIGGWQRKPFPIARVLLPHDADVHDLSLGTRRIDFLRGRGVIAEVVPRVSFADGIEACRLLLPRCWFDREACQKGLEALRAHRPRFDEASQISSRTELHDWASHGAAAFRYAAVGEPLTRTQRAPLQSLQPRFKWD